MIDCRCEVVVGEPKCSEVEMVLPKQICQDIIYGYAEEPKYDHYEVHHILWL